LKKTTTHIVCLSARKIIYRVGRRIHRKTCDAPNSDMYMSKVWVVLCYNLNLAQEVRSLCTGAESCLLSRGLESVSLENTLQRLSRRSLSGSSSSRLTHSGCNRVSSRSSVFRHFV
jgi:hypothetical protein